MSFLAGTPVDRQLPVSCESTPLSTDSTDSTDRIQKEDDPYRHILTHQEKKKYRMPKRKADSWPASILTDPDVLSLDDEGRFVLCKVCHVHYAVHGGKKPKPVIMNSSFRTRAWEVHKERTNSHRLHKKQDGDRTRAQLRRGEEEQKSNENPTHQEALPVQPPPPRPSQSKSHPELDGARFSPPQPPHPSSLASKPPTTAEPPKQLSPRRRPYRSPSAQPPSRPWSTEHEHPRRQMPLERSSVTASATVGMSERPSHASMNAEQSEGLMRWRNMHDDVSRALGSMHKRPMSEAYGASMRLETEDFSGNNERVAKKLKSLDDEYDAKQYKRPEVYFDRRSEAYKQYWGTLRDVYNSANHHPHPSVPMSSSGKQPQSFRRQADQSGYNKGSIDDFTTPDDSGSSEKTVKPVVVHDQALINALDRLTGVISKQFSERYAEETTYMVDAMSKLTNAVDDLRVHQGAALNRLIQLQEQKLHVMEELLRHKLEKQRSSTPHPIRPGSGSS